MPSDANPSENRNRHFLSGGEIIPLGSVIGKGDPYAKGIRPICPVCGELWARINLGLPESGPGEYLVARWPCEKHGNPYFTGGSVWKLLVWWDRGLPPALELALPFFSPELIRREILLRCAQILGEVYSPDPPGGASPPLVSS